MLVVVVGLPVLAAHRADRRALLRRHRAAAHPGRASPAADPADLPDIASGRRRLEAHHDTADADPVLARRRTRPPALPDRGGHLLHRRHAGGRSAIGGTLTIAWDWSIPRGPDNTSLAQLIGLGDSAFARIGFQTAIGLLCLVTLPLVVRRLRADPRPASAALLLTGVAEMRADDHRADGPEGGGGLGRGDRAAPAGARHPRRPAAAAGPPGDGPGPGPAAARQRPGGAARHPRRGGRPDPGDARRAARAVPRASRRRCSPTAACPARWPRWPAGAPSRSSWPSTPTSACQPAGSTRPSRTPRTSRSPRR